MTTDRFLRRSGLLSVAVFVYAVLLVPIVVIILTSFTPRPFPTIPTRGISFEWYLALLENSQLIGALGVSLVIAAFTSVTSGTLGTITAFGFVRSDIPYKETLSTLMLLPLMISPVITGLALVRFAGQLRIGSGFVAVVLGHTVLTLPYVFLIVRAELVTFDRELESASRILGAGPVESVFNITLPVISPAVISSMLIAFVVSFGEFTATQFLVSSGTTTVPVIIYTMTRSGLNPQISALSTVLIGVMFVAALVSGLVNR
ncbi:ABC transporter permease [Haloplanus sp. GCM10025708]|uniref:ABC transporter permease n=1 Tax=Haloferacaceae TaxID=1644056 RepID=UPI003610C453